jgi:hypothetical protein
LQFFFVLLKRPEIAKKIPSKRVLHLNVQLMQPSEKNKQKKRKVKNCIHGNRQTKQEWFRLRLIPYLEQKAKSDLQQQQQLPKKKKNSNRNK